VSDPPARLRDVDGAVLLGGASRRMGRDKAWLPIDGVPCAVRVARALAGACETVWLVGGAAPDAAPGHRVPDPAGPRCALRGLVGALEASRAAHVLVVATDLPWVSPALLSALGAAPTADAVVPRDARGPHPLCARYARATVLAAARPRLADATDLSLRGLLAAVHTVWLEGDALARGDPDGTALTNVNTPEDARRAEALGPPPEAERP
jgi:molybdopterin-guanine dinucleotide biosynthesis protein A